MDSAVLVSYGGSSQLRLTRRGRRPVLADGLFSPDHGDRRPGADQALDFEVDVAAHLLSAKLAGHRGYQAIQTIPGIGPTLAAVFVPLVSELW